MNAESDKMRDTFAEQLSSFDDSLRAKSEDVEMLAEIQKGIGRLLAASGGNEAAVRRVIQERYDAGDLRKETFQLVKAMLDRYVSEHVPTSPSAAAATPSQGDDADDGDPFGSTTVIPSGAFAGDGTGSAEDRVQVGSVLRDRFMLQERVAGGSMGVVYKALDRRLAEAGSSEPWVAIKVLSPQLSRNGKALRALQQEAAKGRNLTHGNIVRFIDLDRDDDLYFIVMEWLDGRTLADILDSADARSIDVEAAFRIVRQVGRALDYAHRCGIVHADVKPANIMILPNGEAKLFDFGVARVRQQQGEGEFDPAVLGAMTPAYASMQVLTGEEPVPADDVFSLGCLLYRLLAGYRVFGPRNAAEAAEEGMTPQRPAGLDDAQWKALKKALSYARVTRFATVGDFLDALDDREASTLAMEAAAEEPERRGRGWIIALVLVIAALAGGYAAWQAGWLDGAPQVASPVGEEPAPAAEAPPAEPEAAAGESDATPVVLPAPVEPTVVEPFGPGTGDRPPLVDFSGLPPADYEVAVSADVVDIETVPIVLRENGRAVIVDFVRTSDIDAPLELRLEEVDFSGNRSPWGSGQYSLSNDGYVEFPPGQERGRLTVSMSPDPLREADQQSTLRVRDAESAESELAMLELTLEDDDQRAFEAGLPANTVAFPVSQVAVRERDPAAQIDLVRFNPDASSLTVDYVISDVTAVSGEDYFAPTVTQVVFGPGQRSARLLIPLVQDTLAEGDEAFVVEITGQASPEASDVYQRIAILIRDDDTPRDSLP